MIWFITLVGYWCALFTSGLIVSALAMLVLSRINSRFFGCLPFGLMLIASYSLLILITLTVVPQDLWNPSYDPAQIALEEFIQEMSPSLHQKIVQLRSRQEETAEKIERFKKLRRERPNFSTTIDAEIVKWQELEDSIQNALEKIHQQTEAALVDYRIDEISGRQKFSSVANEMLEKANGVLEHAKFLQTAVEDTSVSRNEDAKGVDDEQSTLEKLLNEMK